MAPPMVSLGKKEPLKLVFDDLPLDNKEDGAESPSVITIDAEQRARRFRQQKKQKKCRLIVGFITILIIIAVATALTFTLVKLLRKHRSSWTVPEKNGHTTNVVVDDDNHLIHASHHHPNDQEVYMEDLHEYSRQLLAYKDVNKSLCYIDRLEETFETGYARFEGYAYEQDGRHTKALKLIGQPIEIEVLRHIGDIHIYAHCGNGTSYWAMEIEEREITTEMRIVYV